MFLRFTLDPPPTEHVKMLLKYIDDLRKGECVLPAKSVLLAFIHEASEEDVAQICELLHTMAELIGEPGVPGTFKAKED